MIIHGFTRTGIRSYTEKIKRISVVFSVFISVFLCISQAQASTMDVSIKIDGIKPYPGDPISATPIIEITVTASNAVQSIKIALDSSPTDLTFAQVDNKYYATHEVTTPPLTDGIHGITIEAFDISGEATTFEVYPLYVQSVADVTIQGIPLNYPNPFDPGDTNTPTTKIGYTLSKPANITLRIFDLAGNLIVKKDYSSTEQGGRAGYNEVTWDGKSDSGNYVGNGIYIYLIIADGKVVQNGKGKMTVFKQ